MAQVVDYDYIQEVSTEDALRALASDTTNWYTEELPWVNTFLINAENQVINFPEWWWEGIAWWSTNVTWSSNSSSVSWSSGYLYLPDWTSVAISSWSASVSQRTYIYLDQTDNTVRSTNNALDAVWQNKIMICAAFPNGSKNVSYQAFGCADQSTLVGRANISAGAITANEIASNTITANEIASNSITANELSVSKLSAISANLWDITAWTITWTTITAGNTNSTAVVLDPSNQRVRFYYSGSQVWYIMWAYVSWVGSVLSIYWSTTYFWWTVFCGNKLKIPVWSNLYD